tara:strand:- start:219 stop:659 length:441 start_codon:yes stop_codon:yes gene_type:complete
MGNKEMQGGYEWGEFSSQPFEEQGFLNNLVNYLIDSVSPSEHRGAHGEINKLIENADPNAKIARLARMSSGRNITDLFRVLNPDSTIKVVSSTADRYYDDDRYGSINEATYTKAAQNLKQNPESQGMDKNLASYLLAVARNNPYTP